MSETDLNRRALQLFDELCDLPREDRTRLLDSRCSDDPNLRAKVESLLAHDEQPDALIDGSRIGAGADVLAQEVAPSDSADDETPERIGQYRIVREISRGGMGVVYEAEQDNPQRRVALKIVRHGLTSSETIRRFEREAHLLGRLDHPGIAQIFEAGSTRVGNVTLPFFAMEFVDGLTLDRFVSERSLDTKRILELVARVCDAVQHAHQREIIHRDLKPANILVKSQVTTSTGTRSSSVIDAIGQPKVLDFGVARLAEPDAHGVTAQTQAGQIIGTLAYMSPEQLDPATGGVDTRCDVYALGVMLYRFVTGRPPHELSAVSIAEAARRLRDDDPPRAGQHAPELRGDIETIIAKAMHKDREQRYASANELGADLRRYCHNEPIDARPATALYQIRKFSQRNRALVGGAAASVLLLVLGVVGTSFGLIAARRTNQQLEQANRNLSEVSAFQQSQLLNVNPQLMGAFQRNALLDAMTEEDRPTLERLLTDVNFTDTAREALDEHLIKPSSIAIDDRFASIPEVHTQLLVATARVRRHFGLPDDAAESAIRAVETNRQALGEDHEAIVSAREELGHIQLAQGQYEDAEATFREVWDLRRRRHGDTSAPALQAATSVGSVLRHQGKIDEAIVLLRECLNDNDAIDDADEIETLNTKSMLAAALDETGALDEALALMREVADRRRELLGPHDRSTLIAMHNLATALRSSSQLDEAESVIRETIDASRETFGDEHPNTIGSLGTLAALLSDTNRLAEAEEIHRLVVSGRERLLGPTHPLVALSINSLAGVLDMQGKYEEAEPLYRKSLRINKRTLGSDHPNTLTGVMNLGFVLNAMDRPEDAEPLYRQAYEGLERAAGPDHVATLTALGNLGSLVQKLERFDEAERLLIESLQRRTQVLGAAHPSTLNATYNMGDLLLDVGSIDEAEAYCLEALSGYREIDPDHIGTLHSLMLVGDLRMAQDRPEDAEELYREAAERRTRLLGEDHPDTQEAREQLAMAMESQTNPPSE